MAFSEGITSGANTMIACAPDLRKMTSQVEYGENYRSGIETGSTGI